MFHPSRSLPHKDVVYFSFLVTVGPDGTFIDASAFKFVDADAQKTILDINENSKLTMEGDLGGNTLKTNAIRTPRVSGQK